MKLSTKIKLKYWQAVCTGMTHDTLESMLTEALDKMEEDMAAAVQPSWYK